VFAVDVQHVHDLREAFIAHGIHAVAVTGKTKRKERASLLQAFRNKEIPVLINCGVFTEGTDIPVVDCIVMARPTKSHILFQQMLGRGLRLSEGKPNCLVLDFVDNAGRNTAVTVPSLLGYDPEHEMDGEQIVKEEPDKIKEDDSCEQDDHNSNTNINANATGVLRREEVDIFRFEHFRKQAFSATESLHSWSHLHWLDLYDGRYVLNTCHSTLGQIIISQTPSGGISLSRGI
jgi:ATP-dependent helicase IRC3